MKHGFLKKLTSLALIVVMAMAVIPAFVIGAGAASGDYELVTNVADLAEGDQIVIVAKDSDFALSTTQNGNNRGQAAVTKNDQIVACDAGVQVLTLEAGTQEGTFAFSTGAGYLYAASSSKNYLRTETTKTDNSSWAISIASDGTATINAQGSYTRNLLQYNKSSKIFSAYGSAQQAVVIYKLNDLSTDPSCQHTNTETILGEDATCTEPGMTAGEKCVDCGEILVDQTVIEALGHNWADDICSVCGVQKDIYNKVTVDLVDWTGKYLIVGAKKDDSFAMADQNDGYRNQAAVVLTNGQIIAPEVGQIVAVEKSGSYWSLKVGYQYLALTSDGNKLYTTDKNTDGSTDWTISIDAEGIIHIHSVKYPEREIQYNASSTRFACYKGTMGDISLYKLAESPAIKNFNLILNKGVTVNVSYAIPADWLLANEGASVVFRTESGSVLAEHAAMAGQNNYAVTLTPTSICQKLFVALYLSDGTSMAEREVSVAVYTEKIKAVSAEALGLSGAKYEALITLLDKIAAYGDAALLGGSDLSETFDGVADAAMADETDVFGAASAVLGATAGIRLDVNTANIQRDWILNVTMGEKSLVTDGVLADYVTADRCIVIDGFYPANFSDAIVVTISNGTDEVASASFTFNAYLKALYAASADDQALRNLIAAAYQYGVAADAYGAE